MKHLKTTTLALAGLLITGSAATAALTFTPGNSASVYYTHNSGSGIHSYDWGSDGKLYYGTNASYMSDGIYSYDGTTVSTIQAAGGTFSGASVVAIGSSIYFNDSTFSNEQRVFRYDIGTAATVSMNPTNYALGTDGTNLLTTGSDDWSTTDLKFYANGDFGPSINLGNVTGASGPLAFDAQGNLYYAPGYSNTSIYFWTAAEVAAAKGGTPLSSATPWSSYGTLFPDAAGATSMVVDANGDVFVTLTSFAGASDLVKVSGPGNYDKILSSDGRLGETRIHNGNLYVSDGNQIYQVVPEPSSLILSLAACGAFLSVRRRR